MLYDLLDLHAALTKKVSWQLTRKNIETAKTPYTFTGFA